MPFHAIDIALTRPCTRAELDRAAKTSSLPLAADAESRHLMAVVRAKTPAKALRRTRHLLRNRLPIDVITSHYPDASGRVLLNVDIPDDTYHHLQRTARHHHRSPAAQLRDAILQDLAHAERDHADKLDAALDRLLAHSSPHQLLAATVRTLDRTATTHGETRC
jgi:predicted transcriptional regulator